MEAIRRAARRADAMPGVAHVSALLLLLAAVAAIVDPTGLFSSDEGAVLLQADRLGDGDGWIVDHPLHQLDPTGEGFFIRLSDGGPERFAPYAKHPVYPLLLAPIIAVAGPGGAVAVSVLGSLLAAAAAAAIAAEIRASLRWPAFWVVGALSPLFFDAQLVIAHAPAAGAIGWGTWAILRGVRDEQTGWTAGGAILVCAAALLRTEALLFGVALAAALGVAGLRARRARPVLTAAGLGIAALTTALAERVWVRSLLDVGLSPPSSGVAASGTFLGERLGAAVTTLIGFSGAEIAASAYAACILLLVAVLGALAHRIGRLDAGLAVLLAAGAGVAVAIALFGRADAISGLFAAFPLAAFSLVALRRTDLDGGVVPVLALTCGLFTTFVLATQYGVGGGAEWGGRFLAVGLPVSVPVLLVPLARLWSDRPARTVLVALLVASVALDVTAVRVLHRFHEGNRQTVAVFGEIAAAAAPGPDLGDGDRRPVVVTTIADLGRQVWPSFGSVRGLVVAPTDLERVLGDLAARGAEHVVVVQPGGEPLPLHGWRVEEERYSAVQGALLRRMTPVRT